MFLYYSITESKKQGRAVFVYDFALILTPSFLQQYGIVFFSPIHEDLQYIFILQKLSLGDLPAVNRAVSYSSTLKFKVRESTPVSNRRSLIPAALSIRLEALVASVSAYLSER